MKWYHYIAAFWAGAFLCNGIPHFINGVAGDAFPTPFANPPGRGLSTATINVAWGAFNLIIGLTLYRVSKVSWENKVGLALFLISFVAMGFMLSIAFQSRMHY